MLSKSAALLRQSTTCQRKLLPKVRSASAPRKPTPRSVLVPRRPSLIRAATKEPCRTLASTSDIRAQKPQKLTEPDHQTGHEHVTKSESVDMQAIKYRPMDGNQAAAYVAYALSDISFIYPISPATSMGEYMDEWANHHMPNIFGQPVSVNMMQSEAGAAGALHGAGAAGALTSTFTASQGLLLMIPNMYLLAGELVPAVFHVSARAVSKHALSIFNDHSDVMSCRTTGFAIICSSSVQEVMDLGCVAHMASCKSRLPFLNFFDGYRTSAEISKIEPITYDAMASIFPYEAQKEHLHNYALNPNNPMARGTGQRPDIYFQNAVAAHKYYLNAPGIVEEVMHQVETITGRTYNLFDYHGSPTAERVAVLMGSASKSMEEMVDYMNDRGENVGVLTVRLYRPWSADHFYAALPQSAKKIAVLDRTREDGAAGTPLFLDVNVTLSDKQDPRFITSGQYGLASKEFTPAMAKAVFENLDAAQPKNRYVVGIEDDVTFTSLPYGKSFSTVPKGTSQCLLYGLGGDGLVGASKSIIKTISDNTALKAQGHFVFDSKKTDGLTVSHLRFGPEPIKASYGINTGADFVECAHRSYIRKYDMLTPLKKGGTFVLNSYYGSSMELLEQKLPPHFKKQLAEKNAVLYNIDAVKVADEVGLGKRRVNSIMSAAFYTLSGVLPQEKALDLLKKTIAKQYSHKGPEVVTMNQQAVDATVTNLQRIEYPRDQWLNAVEQAKEKAEVPEFVDKVMFPVLSMLGDELPVSQFEPGGYQPTETTLYEKRALAPEVPVWVPDKCTQCNYCALVCPHAVVRPFLLDRGESKQVPEGYEYRKAKGGPEVAGYNYSIQISPMDCTGCAVCVESCPDDALYMAPYEDVQSKVPHWDFSTMALTEKTNVGDKYSVKGSQFEKPLLEFSCACSGCGETPYLKLATQLFGSRMVIANASGCSSVWGGTSTTIPFAKNAKGQGPAWGRSLFEDNAEYGLGMMLGTHQRRNNLAIDIEKVLKENPRVMSDRLKNAFTKWLQFKDDSDQGDLYTDQIMEELAKIQPITNDLLLSIENRNNLLRRQSHWMCGGDGWAYDIGLGGVDHVLSLGHDVNLLVLDTEMYSNTGGEMSKSTPAAASVKYATGGKEKQKKDLGMHAMLYENVYVASVAMGASYNQTVQALKEAESFPGPSLVLCYAPCIDWGIDMRYMMEGQKQAVDSGYWTLYRHDPRRIKEGLNPFQLDSKKIRGDMAEFLRSQNRFTRLFRDSKEHADELQHSLEDYSLKRHQRLANLSMDDQERLEFLMEKLNVTGAEGLAKDKSIVLYGSETGNAQDLAAVFSSELKRRDIVAKALAMDDFDFDSMPKYTNVYCVVSTAGQGEFPNNCKEFWKTLTSDDVPADFLTNTNFAVFGLGDSGYVYFNEAAKNIDKRMEEIGGQRLLGLGLGDDKDDERYETAWTDWTPNLWNELGTPPPPQELLAPSYDVRLDSSGGIKGTTEPILAPGSKLLSLTKNELLTPPEYDRVIRHYEFDIKGTGFMYGVGDCLGIHPNNDEEEVSKFLDSYGLDKRAVALLEDKMGRKDTLPAVVDVRRLFTEVFDIFGRPMRRFYETLAIAAKDETEKKDLEYMMTKEGQEKYKQFVAETVTYADLLLNYPSTKLSIDYLIDHLPRMKPRLYSIASSSEMHPDQIQLCVVKDDWTTPTGRYRQGLNTRYMEKQSLMPDTRVDQLACRMSAAGIEIPDTQRPPYVMVALGTGIAPMRAMLQERDVAKQRGETVGEMALFFGARYRASEYSYGDEFDTWAAGSDPVLTVLSTAFSRDQEHKIYVQNRISEHPEVIYDYLVTKKGYFYLCGPAGNVPPAVRKAVCEAFSKCGGMTVEEADKMVTQMQIEGRYNLDTW